MPIDLTAFNGIDPGNDPDVISHTNEHQFYARQRGQHNSPAGTNNLWSQEPFNQSPTQNTDLTAQQIPHGHIRPAVQSERLAAESQPGVFERSVRRPQYHSRLRGRSNITLPLAHLAQSSLCKSLGNDASVLVAIIAIAGLVQVRLAKPGDDPYTRSSQPSFSHLTNFFLSGTTTPDEELHRIFEFLQVPSPFVGTETQANPASAESTGHTFRPPFNGISNYRVPGKINLNTIYDKCGFRGIDERLAVAMATSSWTNFVQSRRNNRRPRWHVLGWIPRLDLPNRVRPTLPFVRRGDNGADTDQAHPAPIQPRDQRHTAARTSPTAGIR